MNTFNSNVLLGNGVVLLVIAIATSLTNGTLLLTIYRNPLRCFRTTGGTLIAVLAVTDLMTGAVTALNVGIFSILNSQRIPSLRIGGVIQEKLVSQFTVRCGVFSITAFSFDRLLAVAFPFFYRKYITTKVITLAAITLCPLVFLSSFIEIFVDPVLFNQVTLYGLFVAPFVVLTLNYIATYTALKLQFLKVKRSVHPVSNHRTQEMARLKRERSLFHKALFVVCGFVFSFCPWLVVLGITSYCPSCTKESWYFALYRSTIPFMYLNSAFNPLLYAWRIGRYRRSILKAILGQRSKDQNSGEETPVI